MRAPSHAYEVCAKYMKEVVRVCDGQIRAVMHFLFKGMKAACESSYSDSAAAMLGPLKNRVKDK